MSYYISLSGLKAAQTNLDVISNNVANSETDGFKRSRVDFDDVIAASALSNQRQTVGLGVTVGSITQDFAVGPIEQTGGALNLAVAGDGFFSTISQTNGQTYFTRKGAFEMDAGGYVTDASGNRLQMYAGSPPATTPSDALIPLANSASSPFAAVTVSEDGTITASYADGSNTVVGGLALASFTAPTQLKAVGNSNWVVTGQSGNPSYGAPAVGAFGKLMSGALERSNVDLSEELVDLITAQRYFQANAKAIDTATQVSQTVINLRS